MRSNQWYVLGFVFLILSFIFIWQDSMLSSPCHKATLDLFEQKLEAKETFTTEENSLFFTCTTLQEIYDPFIYFTGLMWIGFWICGWLERRAKH
ncbi:MAG: hypothetical protein KAU20_04425 [Nanoarchaeota archaeon]|nr:hypothetical protein [Nanoarchaeota archaeon]